MSTPSHDTVIDATRDWLNQAVIGLNLCPFAKAAETKQLIRYVVSDATDAEGLLRALIEELEHMRDADPKALETTLLIHPQVLGDFLDYNDFLDVADAALAELDLEGEIQVASFHPQYQFEGTEPDDIENFTNRSPYPTLHLLRESSIEQAVKAFPDAASIYEANIETMERLGIEGWHKLFPPR